MLRRPDAYFFVKLYRSRMVRHGEIGDGLRFLGPALEERMDGLQLREIVPSGFQQRCDCLVAYLRGADELKRITDNVGIAPDASGWI
jgi:hypothetical protein